QAEYRIGAGESPFVIEAEILWKSGKHHEALEVVARSPDPMDWAWGYNLSKSLHASSPGDPVFNRLAELTTGEAAGDVRAARMAWEFAERLGRDGQAEYWRSLSHDFALEEVGRAAANIRLAPRDGRSPIFLTQDVAELL